MSSIWKSTCHAVSITEKLDVINIFVVVVIPVTQRSKYSHIEKGTHKSVE